MELIGSLRETICIQRSASFHWEKLILTHENTEDLGHGGKFSNRTLSYILKESGLIEVYRCNLVGAEDHFCIAGRTIKHAQPNMAAMYRKLANHMEHEHPHEIVRGCRAKYEIKNQIYEGEALLAKKSKGNRRVIAAGGDIGGDDQDEGIDDSTLFGGVYVVQGEDLS